MDCHESSNNNNGIEIEMPENEQENAYKTNTTNGDE